MGKPNSKWEKMRTCQIMSHKQKQNGVKENKQTQNGKPWWHVNIITFIKLNN